MKKINYRKLILALADVFIIVVSGIVLNFAMSLIFPELSEASRGLLYTIIVNLALCMLIMYGAGAYKRLWRYFNEKDYLVCGLAMFAGFALGYLIMSILQIQQSVLFVALYAILATGGVLLFRFIFKRTFLNLIEVGRADNCERTLIVGAGNAGRMILTEIQNASYDENSPARNLIAVGFVDDDETKLNRSINGVPVLGFCREISKICNDKKITNIIVAVPSCEEEEKRKILDYCSETTCKIKIIPYLTISTQSLFHRLKKLKLQTYLAESRLNLIKKK